ncbi:acyl-CoA N-acyltransferase [Whalleya microplaca]|nr:acyl-CoA N-acyltransferase [Whalleya microplaca]
MAPLKRKRPHDVATEVLSQTQVPTRRATRQHPTEPERQLRSGRIRADPTEKTTPAIVDTVVARGRRDDAPKTAPPSSAVPVKQTRTTRHAANDAITTTTTTTTAKAAPLKENIRPSSPPPRIKNTHVSPPRHALQTAHPQPSAAPSTRPKSPSQSRVPAPKQPQHAPRPTTNLTPKRPLSDKPPKPPPTPRSDRNIDKVVLGNIIFKAWYPSYYGKDVLGDGTGNAGGKDERAGGSKDNHNNQNRGGAKIGGGKREPPVLDRLYVCPCCFKYSKELVLWWEHVRCCERRGAVPGVKVYTHPRGSRTRTVRVPAAAAAAVDPTAASVVPPPVGTGKGKGRKAKNNNAGAGVVTAEETVSDLGEWSVWEVDGEKDILFCQNLSLFAKLFLDNKSVFFDVTGFNYFLLVYTPAAADTHPHAHAHAPADPPLPPSPTDTSHTSQPPPPPANSSRPQIVGFFSKEKMSWDNNNLACILVFPPWQRKGLGALLMGVSYAISRRERILGGPEKPISELGRRGYKRFWAGEIARWLLGLPLPDPVPGDGDEEGAETLVDIETCSKATWIVPEDCLAVLREMGVVADAGVGPVAGAEAPNRDTVAGEEAEGLPQAQVHKGEVKVVPRVRVDKAAVRRWVDAHEVDLSLPCDPDGFVDGYAVKEVDEAEAMEEG